MHGPLWSPAHHEGPLPRQSGVHVVDPRLRAKTARQRIGYAATREAAMAAFAKGAGVKGVDRPAVIQNDSGLPQGPAHLDLAGWTRS
jgi:hypothetical protein